VFEMALNAVQPQNMVEAMLCGYTIGMAQGRGRSGSNPLARPLAQMGS